MTDLSYSVGVIPYAFDISGEDRRLFTDVNERNTYFEKAVAESYLKWIPLIAPELNDGIHCIFKLDIKDKDYLTALNNNYLVLKNSNNHYMFFFIRSSSIVSGSTLSLECEIDELQTYLYDCEFNDCLIERAHLDRFDMAPDGKGSEVALFKNGVSSPLYGSEGENLPKYLKSKEVFIPKSDLTPKSEFNEFMDVAKVKWVYVYLTPNTEWLTLADHLVFDPQWNTNYLNAYAPYQIVAIPIIEDDYYKIYFQFEDTTFTPAKSTKVSNTDLLKYFNKRLYSSKQGSNDAMQDVYAIKISPKSPFEAHELVNGVDYSVNTYANEERLVINCVDGKSKPNDVINVRVVNSGEFQTELDELKEFHLQVSRWPRENLVETIKMNDIKVGFSKDEILSSNKELIDWEPKMLSNDVIDLKVSSPTGNNFVYDIQKMLSLLTINQSDYSFMFNVETNEVLTPDITKGFIKLKDDTGFYQAQAKTYQGNYYSYDGTIPYDKTQLGTFLANNKNFFLQQQNNRDFNIFSLLGGFGLDAGKMGILGALGMITNPLIGGIGLGADILGKLIGTGVSNTKSLMDQNFMIDNLKNAPESLQSTESNIFIPLLTKNIDYFIEIWTASDFDKSKLWKYIITNGYAFNQYDNVLEYIHTRVAFNFIKAQIKTIDAPLSTDIKQRIRDRFSAGIRFWHTDNIDLFQNNHEVYIIETTKESDKNE